jgi:hypothetical protein
VKTRDPWEETLENGLLSLEEWCQADKRPSQGTRGSLEPQSRFEEKVSRSDKNLTDTDPADGRVYPRDAGQASS